MSRGAMRVCRVLAEVALILFLVGCVAVFTLSHVGSSCPASPYRVYERGLVAVAFAVERFQVDCGVYPGRLQELVDGQQGSGCRGHLPPKVPAGRDYWGSAYLYSVSAGGAAFQLRSPGADRVAFTADDIVWDKAAWGSWRGHYDSVNWLRLVSTAGTLLAMAITLVGLSRLLWRGVAASGRFLRRLRGRI